MHWSSNALLSLCLKYRRYLNLLLIYISWRVRFFRDRSGLVVKKFFHPLYRNNNEEIFMKHYSRALKSMGLLMVFHLVFAGVSFADQIKIVDHLGNTRSMAVVNVGATAEVKVAISASQNELAKNATVRLVDLKTGTQVKELLTDSRGHVSFSNVPAGNYKIVLNNKQVQIANVEIDDSVTAEVAADSSSRAKTVALYAGGISAVGGGAAIALSGGSSSSSGSTDSAASQLSSFGSTDLASSTGSSAGRNTASASSSSESFDTSAVVSPAPTPSGTISPAPSGTNLTENDPVTTVTGNNGPPTTTVDENGNIVVSTPTTDDTPPAAPTPTPAPPVSGS